MTNTGSNGLSYPPPYGGVLRPGWVVIVIKHRQKISVISQVLVALSSVALRGTSILFQNGAPQIDALAFDVDGHSPAQLSETAAREYKRLTVTVNSDGTEHVLIDSWATHPYYKGALFFDGELVTFARPVSNLRNVVAKAGGKGVPLDVVPWNSIIQDERYVYQKQLKESRRRQEMRDLEAEAYLDNAFYGQPYERVIWPWRRAESGVIVNRAKFLKDLKALWKADGNTKAPLTLEDLLDDAASLGMAGAGDVYINLLKSEAIQAHDISNETGNID